jgi:hypothetical protein
MILKPGNIKTYLMQIIPKRTPQSFLKPDNIPYHKWNLRKLI